MARAFGPVPYCPAMDDLPIIPISALEHYSYCPRQCALIHVEGTYLDNFWTARGSVQHRRVDERVEWRGGREVRAMALFSDVHGLIGRADAVVTAPDEPPFPVEHKSGVLRTWVHEAIQLCAQALCLEEMFEVGVPRGAVYYVGSRRRREVAFDAGLRDLTLETVRRVRQMLIDGVVPVEQALPRCRHCSLRPACLPDVTSRPPLVDWHTRSLNRVVGDG
jgi:CRISPR-associated exonuclease Cas4